MDRIIYTAANGASRTLEHQAALSNNLANANTTGFKAQLAAYRSVPVTHLGQDASATTRVMTAATASPSLFDKGPITTTGRPLDVAIDGDGWLAIQTNQGEAYTRAGNLHRNAQGQLVTGAGHLVLSADDQPIDLGDAEKIEFSKEGGINVIPQGGRARDVQRVAQLKLVNPPLQSLTRSDDGLFRVMNAQGQAQPALADPAIRVLGGSLEGSNVSPTESMVGLIENARRFEMQMKIISDANTNAQSANSILSING